MYEVAYKQLFCCLFFFEEFAQDIPINRYIYIGTNSLTFFKICFYNLNVSTEKNCKTQTTEYDDFTGREEQLRIAPCRRCARIGKDRIDGMRMCFQL